MGTLIWKIIARPLTTFGLIVALHEAAFFIFQIKSQNVTIRRLQDDLISNSTILSADDQLTGQLTFLRGQLYIAKFAPHKWLTF